jgi:hypothetical protein
MLYNAMRALPIGGHLVIFETPNRLAPLDWHTTRRPFWNILPDELARIDMVQAVHPGLAVAAKYQGIHSLDQKPHTDATGLYRVGRGASYHEIALACGLDSFKVVRDGSGVRAREVPSAYSIPANIAEDYRKALAAVLAPLGVPEAFSYTSLDLVLEKTAEPRRFDQAP